MTKLYDPEVRAKLKELTPEALQALMTPGTMRKLRGYKILFLLLLAFIVGCFAYGVFEIVNLMQMILPLIGSGSSVQVPRLEITKIVALSFGGMVLARLGIRWCHAQIIRLIDTDLEQGLSEKS